MDERDGPATAVTTKRSIFQALQPAIVAATVGSACYLAGHLWVGALVSAAVSGGSVALVDAALPHRRALNSSRPAPLPIGFWLMLALGLALVDDGTNHAVGLRPGAACLVVGAAWAALWAVHKGTVSLGRFARERLLVVGSGEVASHVAEAFATQRGSLVVGFVHDDREEDLSPVTPVVGRMADLELLIARHRISNVIFAYSSLPDRAMVQAVRRCRAVGVQVGIVSRMFQELDRRTVLRRVDSIPILTIEPTLADSHTPSLSRAVDICAALILAVLSLPLFVVIAVAIMLESRGGLFYRATRVGYQGHQFSMLKFRKMRPDASGPRITVGGDQRFSRVGRFLAASKLDELPQLWNVLRGDMTLVGPRPEDPHYVALYPEEYEKILSVRPGVTGLAQIQFRDEASLLLGDDYEEQYSSRLLPAKITIDRYYAERRSLKLDLRIMAWTLVAVLRGARVEHHPLTDAVHFRRGEITSFDPTQDELDGGERPGGASAPRSYAARH